jgi:hypothetical protein
MSALQLLAHDTRVRDIQAQINNTPGPYFRVYREERLETPLTDQGIPLLANDTQVYDCLADDTPARDISPDDTMLPPPVDFSGLYKPCGVGLFLALAAKVRAYIQGPSTSEWVKAPSSYSGRWILQKYLAAPLNDKSITMPWVTTPEGKCPLPRVGKDAVFSFTPHPTDQDRLLVWIRGFKKSNPYEWD